ARLFVRKGPRLGSSDYDKKGRGAIRPAIGRITHRPVSCAEGNPPATAPPLADLDYANRFAPLRVIKWLPERKRNPACLCRFPPAAMTGVFRATSDASKVASGGRPHAVGTRRSRRVSIWLLLRSCRYCLCSQSLRSRQTLRWTASRRHGMRRGY